MIVDYSLSNYLQYPLSFWFIFEVIKILKLYF